MEHSTDWYILTAKGSVMQIAYHAQASFEDLNKVYKTRILHSLDRLRREQLGPTLIPKDFDRQPYLKKLYTASGRALATGNCSWKSWFDKWEAISNDGLQRIMEKSQERQRVLSKAPEERRLELEARFKDEIDSLHRQTDEELEELDRSCVIHEDSRKALPRDELRARIFRETEGCELQKLQLELELWQRRPRTWESITENMVDAVRAYESALSVLTCALAAPVNADTEDLGHQDLVLTVREDASKICVANMAGNTILEIARDDLSSPTGDYTSLATHLQKVTREPFTHLVSAESKNQPCILWGADPQHMFRALADRLIEKGDQARALLKDLNSSQGASHVSVEQKLELKRRSMELESRYLEQLHEMLVNDYVLDKNSRKKIAVVKEKEFLTKDVLREDKLISC
eukprot:TRINITY_DN8003_c0_g1_i2.p1 TRINITY_DN8003_c0_g1~~TRINITY_DN8003_c0_g1_i2.p1  ORF type:complete len:404 (+),score=68.75 TRINITY_DN8003_c0_g1_i2:28-1239(+)